MNYSVRESEAGMKKYMSVSVSLDGETHGIHMWYLELISLYVLSASHL